MVSLVASNHQHLKDKDLEEKLAKLKPHLVGRGPMKRILEAKLRELEAKRRLFDR